MNGLSTCIGCRRHGDEIGAAADQITDDLCAGSGCRGRHAGQARAVDRYGTGCGVRRHVADARAGDDGLRTRTRRQILEVGRGSRADRGAQSNRIDTKFG